MSEHAREVNGRCVKNELRAHKSRVILTERPFPFTSQAGHEETRTNAAERLLIDKGTLD